MLPDRSLCFALSFLFFCLSMVTAGNPRQGNPYDGLDLARQEEPSCCYGKITKAPSIIEGCLLERLPDGTRVLIAVPKEVNEVVEKRFELSVALPVWIPVGNSIIYECEDPLFNLTSGDSRRMCERLYYPPLNGSQFRDQLSGSEPQCVRTTNSSGSSDQQNGFFHLQIAIIGVIVLLILLMAGLFVYVCHKRREDALQRMNVNARRAHTDSVYSSVRSNKRQITSSHSGYLVPITRDEVRQGRINEPVYEVIDDETESGYSYPMLLHPIHHINRPGFVYPFPLPLPSVHAPNGVKK